MTIYLIDGLRLSYILFIALMLAAAVTDVWKFKIPNWLSLAVVGLFFATALVASRLPPFEVNWLSHIGAGFLMFVVGLLLFRFRVMGAGDIKLIAAVSFWTGLEGVLHFFVAVAICGGIVTLFLIATRWLLGIGQLSMPMLAGLPLPKVLQRGEAIPYGLGIAGGAIALLLHQGFPPFAFIGNSF